MIHVCGGEAPSAPSCGADVPTAGRKNLQIQITCYLIINVDFNDVFTTADDDAPG